MPKDIEKIFYQLIRLSIDSTDQMPADISAEEWDAIYAMAEKQSLQGVVFRGVAKMPEDRRPPYEVQDDWLVDAHLCHEANNDAYKALASVSGWFGDKGLRTCVLKGQGNALLYPDRYVRTSGDIDLWVEGGEAKVLALVRHYCGDKEFCYHHIKFSDFGGIAVEVHYRPSFLNNMISNHLLQQYFEAHADEQFTHFVDLPDGAGRVCVPTIAFNRIFQLTHIVHHFFHEGIGLRQLLDYYFVLRQGFTEDERKKDLRLMRRMRIYKMARAVMYIEQRVFGLEASYCLVPPDEKAGRKLLAEIMTSGNFGHYDKRIGHNSKASKPVKNLQRLYRDALLMASYPSESLWEPVFRLWHFFWRRTHSYNEHKSIEI